MKLQEYLMHTDSSDEVYCSPLEMFPSGSIPYLNREDHPPSPSPESDAEVPDQPDDRPASPPNPLAL